MGSEEVGEEERAELGEKWKRGVKGTAPNERLPFSLCFRLWSVT